MTLAVLLLLAIATAGMVIALTWRWAAVVAPNPPSAMDTARRAGRAMRRHPGAGSALATRLDPRAATGLGLTLALIAIVGGGVVLAVLAYLIRGNTDLVRLDESVASWGDRHASAFSTDGLNAVTHLGEPVVVAGLAAILAVVETARTRSAWVVPFLLIVVAGNGIMTTTVKDLADRVRPDAEPDRGDARAVVPERSLVVVRRVFRGGGAAAQPRVGVATCGRSSPEPRRDSS